MGEVGQQLQILVANYLGERTASSSKVQEKVVFASKRKE